jgi:plasmid stabilization system protein ParE
MAQRKIIWSAAAKFDLSAILDFYYKRNGTKTYSKKLNSNIRKSLRLLEKQPEIGLQTDIQNIRILIKGDYSIFYEIRPHIVEIITIWNNSQNPENLNIDFTAG